MQDASDTHELRRLIVGYRISQALSVAARLGIADLLADGPRSAEALAAKRARMEEAVRIERKRIEEVLEETNRQIEEMKGQIVAEKETAAEVLRSEVSRLSRGIAEKVLGRQVA